jgi:sugar phosphate isomerase/epimerase
MLMNRNLNRRQFITRTAGTALTLAGAAGGAATAPLAAMEPVPRRGAARLRLSLAAYSFRDYFKDTTGKRPAGIDASRLIDLFQFVDFCAEHGCVGTELTSYYFPPDPTPEFLLRLKRHAFLSGVAVSGTAVGNTFTVAGAQARAKEIAHVKKWVDYAAILGAPHIRVFAGNAAKDQDKAEAKRLTIAALEECCEYAGSKGVFLGLENHGGIVAEVDDLLEIVRAVKSPWFGVNLDSGNFHTDDPYDDLAKCAPYAVNVQFKCEISRRGKPKEESDLKVLTAMLKAARYQGYVALEYESAEDPWTAVPRWLARMRAALSDAG